MTGKQVKEAREAYLKGFTLKEIEREYGYKASTVRCYIKDILRPAHVTKSHYSGLGKEKVEEMLKLYRSGLTYSQTAKKMGCSPSTVKKYAVLHNCAKKNIKTTPEVIDRIKRLMDIGANANDISQTTDVSISKVYSIMRDIKGFRCIPLSVYKAIETAYKFGDDALYTSERLKVPIHIVRTEFTKLKMSSASI